MLKDCIILYVSKVEEGKFALLCNIRHCDVIQALCDVVKDGEKYIGKLV